MPCFFDTHGRPALFRTETEEWIGVAEGRRGEGTRVEEGGGNFGLDVK